ncbi:lipoprotein [Mesoplasma lactucae]|uniref:Uncharacterized protein n=1 Tax=Mesoplasma lactucae ATCC 49193 TaxID=81460 RepID=A0A291IRI3_9MOLU|nr:lipoprotein [Mesoplasma lactucae]ATG97393.1 hypothetical protein CP520_01295 [Mesoplasma lactucae ATCC 49193]ATZ20154.1 hypothetical protein MLACT_v1c03330 [Mesoplasma lactucae ATCC 49193]MCL8216903.1 hypothetical protein [Mesoplasma lactucae ATCC 49193]
MRKFLSILAAVGLTATASTSVVSCSKYKNVQNTIFNSIKDITQASWARTSDANAILVPSETIGNADAIETTFKDPENIKLVKNLVASGFDNYGTAKPIISNFEINFIGVSSKQINVPKYAETNKKDGKDFVYHNVSQYYVNFKVMDPRTQKTTDLLSVKILDENEYNYLSGMAGLAYMDDMASSTSPIFEALSKTVKDYDVSTDKWTPAFDQNEEKAPQWSKLVNDYRANLVMNLKNGTNVYNVSDGTLNKTKWIPGANADNKIVGNLALLLKNDVTTAILTYRPQIISWAKNIINFQRDQKAEKDWRTQKSNYSLKQYPIGGVRTTQTPNGKASIEVKNDSLGTLWIQNAVGL